MYPVEFPRQQWYVAAMSREVTREFLSRWILDEPVCLYRTEDGAPVALVDRCIHRQMPLSRGRLRGDLLECGYHGVTYAPDGRAVRIPSQDYVPPACGSTAIRWWRAAGWSGSGRATPSGPTLPCCPTTTGSTIPAAASSAGCCRCAPGPSCSTRTCSTSRT